jgi:hypothetical protein
MRRIEERLASLENSRALTTEAAQQAVNTISQRAQ